MPRIESSSGAASRFVSAVASALLLLSVTTACDSASQSKAPVERDKARLDPSSSPTAIFGDSVIEYWDARLGTTEVDGRVTAWTGQVRGTTVTPPDPATTTAPTLGPDGDFFNGQPVIQCGNGRQFRTQFAGPLVPAGTRPYFAFIGRLQQPKTDTGRAHLVSFDHTPPPDAQGDSGVHIAADEGNHFTAYYRMTGLSPEVPTTFPVDTDVHVFEHALRPDIGIELSVDGARAATWTQSTPWPLWYVRPALQAGLDTVTFCPLPGWSSVPVSIAQIVLLSAPPTDAQRAAFLAASRNDLGVGYCGDGVTNGREQCDDGNSIDGDNCRNDCTHRMCGGGADQSCPPGCPNGQCGPTVLDSVSVEPVAAYSVADRLSSLYLGPAFRVRRSSDGAEADIGFTGTNQVDEGQVSAFCGSSDCSLSIFYDQGGKGRDLPQTVADNQIKLYDGASQSMTKTGTRPVLSVVDSTKNVWRHESFLMAENPAVTVAYVGRFVHAGPTGGDDACPIRLGIEDSTSNEANEIALSYDTGTNYIYFGSGGMHWPFANNSELHRTLFMHGAGATVGASSELIDEQLVQPQPVGDAANQSFHIGLGGGLLIGKHPSNQSGAVAEVQTVILWNQFLAGEDAYGVSLSLPLGADLCPDDPNKRAPGACGCGIPEANPCVISTGAPDRQIPAGSGVPITEPATPALLPGLEGTYSPADGYYTELHYAPNDGQHEQLSFCDGYGNPIPAPSEADLNAPPPQGSTCLGLVDDGSSCPVDPDTLTNQVCSTDVDCDASMGYVCGTKCVDTECLVLAHYCGKHAASCGGLTPEDNCQDYQMCDADGVVGTDAERAEHDLERAEQLPPTTTSSQIAPGDQTTLAGLNPVKDSDICFIGSDVGDLHDALSKPALSTPKKKWGVYMDHNLDYGMKPAKNGNWITELSDLHGSGKFAVGGIIWGAKIEALDAEAGVTLTDCGVDIAATAKLFGEAIVALTAEAGHDNHVDLLGPGKLGTPTSAKSSCESAKQQAKDALQAVRKSNLFAREVAQYYKDNSLTPELCRSIVAMVPDAEKDTLGSPYNCDDLDNLPASRKVDLLAWWKKEYDAQSAKYPDYSNALGIARQQVESSGTIDLFDIKHPYDLKILDQDFPIGPIDLNLAIEGYGSWDIKGGVQWGIGFSTSLQSGLAGVSDVLQHGTPSIGDIRAYAGPVMTPELDVGLLAFVGVGIPGVSVGIEGKIDLLQASLPMGAVAAAMRVSEDDRRDLSQTDYAGAVKPNMANKNYQWVLGYNFGASLDLSELDGKLDLAARLHILFFKKTFRVNLFNWTGFHQHFPLVAGGGGGAIAYEGDLGKQGDTVAYTEIAPIMDAEPKVAPTGPYPRVCDIAPD